MTIDYKLRAYGTEPFIAERKACDFCRGFLAGIACACALIVIAANVYLRMKGVL